MQPWRCCWSYTPNTQRCRQWRPRWYFERTITDSSIWTMVPTPPSTRDTCRSFQEQMSRKYWYHCTTVAEDTPTCPVTLVMLVSHDQKYSSARCFDRQVLTVQYRPGRQRLLSTATRTEKDEAGHRSFLADLIELPTVRLALNMRSQHAVPLHPRRHCLVASYHDHAEVEDDHT